MHLSKAIQFRSAALAIFVATALGTSASGSVETHNFVRLTNTNVENLGNQLLVDIWDTAQSNSSDFIDFYDDLGFTVSPIDISPAEVLFVFRNNVGVASVIAQIYFETNTVFSARHKIWDDDDNTNLNAANDADFSSGAGGSPNLPAGNTAIPPFVANDIFSADADSPAPGNGVNSASDLLGISFTLNAGKDYSDVITAIGNNSLRIGLHVTGIGAAGGSDSYLNNGIVFPPPTGDPPVIPEPASVAVWSLLVGIAAFLSMRAK